MAMRCRVRACASMRRLSVTLAPHFHAVLRSHLRNGPMSELARTPPPPYYAAVSTSTRTSADEPGYEKAAQRMVELAAQQPGFLGVESARGDDGLGITVSYWDSLEAIANWKKQAEHRAAQAKGRSD